MLVLATDILREKKEYRTSRGAYVSQKSRESAVKVIKSRMPFVEKGILVIEKVNPAGLKKSKKAYPGC